jgi:hypothetical protein
MKALVKSSGRLIPEFPSLLDDIFDRDIFNWPVERFSGSSSVPSVNIKETKKQLRDGSGCPRP